jgi:predicted nucleotidyltransferase
MKAFGIDQKYLELLAKLFEKHLADIPSSKVWIFGSRAKGKQRPNSDIDLLISAKTKKIKDKIAGLGADLKDSDLPFVVDIVYQPELANEFKAEVLKTRMMFWNPEMIRKRSPWRVCPLGHHWVSRHDRAYPSGISDVDGYCRSNKKNRDVIHYDEIKLIERSAIFANAPKPKSFKSKPNWGKEYDGQVAGWTQYWNDILDLKNPIDPSLVKALIASESSFDPSSVPKGVPIRKQARGLIQIMPETRKVLQNIDGELKNYLVNINPNDLFDPSAAIAAGIRWLVRKQQLASRKLKREASWKEAVLEYKGILMQDPKRGKNPVIRKRLADLYQDLGI